MSTTPNAKKPSGNFSPELVAMLKAATPAQREQATGIAARLLAIKAHRKR
jgi:hypothetical protein